MYVVCLWRDTGTDRASRQSTRPGASCSSANLGKINRMRQPCSASSARPNMRKNRKMDLVKKQQLDRLGEVENQARVLSAAAASRPPLTSVLRSLGSSLDDRSLSPAPASAQDWSALIERVRAAASHAREVEIQAREQEQRVEELLERVREDVAAAAERVRAAEARVSSAEARAEARIRAAEERAEAAEERARTAEEWLQRVHEAVASEFSAVPVGKPAA